MTQIPVPNAQPVIEILHLDEMGYGPNGSMRRRAWREACFGNLLAGREQFETWQNCVKAEHTESPKVSFGLQVNGKNEYDEFSDLLNPCTLDFAAKECVQDLIACEFKFILPSIFYYTIFFGQARFDNAVFSEKVGFDNAVFKIIAGFINATLINANFYNVNFNRSADFRNTKFNGNYVNFNKAFFNSPIEFDGGEFPSNYLSFNNILFKEAEFVQSVSFKNISFKAKTSFVKAKFHATVEFKNCKFEELCVFDEAKFGFDAQSYMYGIIDFQNTIFKNDAKFNNTEFRLITKFILAEFYGDVEFNNAKFHKDVRFFGVLFKGGIFFNESGFYGDAAKRLGYMKQLMETSGAHEQALNFNANELHEKARKENSSIWFKLITLLYENLSDYGRSFTKPILWYFALISFGAILAMGYSTYIANPSQEVKKLCASTKEQPAHKLSYERAIFEYAMFRADGVTDFTDTGKQNNAVNCRLFDEPIEPLFMRIWGVFKAIASTALLFLVALGLRNKYRIK